jgi:hypothetical protein
VDCVPRDHPAPQLKGLTIPVLVVTSTRDYPSFQAMAREYDEALPNSRLEELDAGQMAPCERSDRFNAVLRAFLDEQGSALGRPRRAKERNLRAHAGAAKPHGRVPPSARDEVKPLR